MNILHMAPHSLAGHALSIESLALVACALLSLLLAVATIGIHFKRFGGRTIRSNRDGYPSLNGAAGRVVRAHGNLGEALLPFAIVVLTAQAAQVSNRWTVGASIVFCVARVIHAALYVVGIAEWRSLAYYIGLAATLVLAAEVGIAATA